MTLFNACEYLLDRHVEAGDGDRLALTGTEGDYSYADLLTRVRSCAAGLRAFGVAPEQRVLLVMSDSPDFVTAYLAAMRIGAVPVPVSTMLRADGLAELVHDSRAVLVVITPEFAALAGEAAGDVPVRTLAELSASGDGSVYDTTADSPAFWLYTSGTTGLPKGAMHRHGSIRVVCETYGTQVLGIRPDDRCLSAAKAFFAYGLGNSVLFPLAVGAAAVLEPAPSRPDTIVERAQKYGATLFFAGPTFFANMLRAGLPADTLSGVRLSASAGEPLPGALYRRWTTHFGVDILDGIGMTEMLHIFLSNREGQVKAGTTGVAVPGYDLRILDEDGRPVPQGEPGTLFVRGESTATGYWSRYDASRTVFQGEWLRTGDTYVQDADGYYQCLGRTGDMLKASGIWVSPAEVEGRLLAHDAVGQAVVVAAPDADGLEKPIAYVLLTPGADVTEDELIAWCREGLPSFKRPRRIIFVDAYPTTATGKIRRVDLRASAATVLTETAPVSGSVLMLDGRPLVDVHLHAANRSTLKVPWDIWVGKYGSPGLDAIYQASGEVRPSSFESMLEGEGVDIAVLLAEYSPRVTGWQPVEHLVPLASHRVRFAANINPHVHFPVEEELQRQIHLGAVALKVHPVHAGLAVNDQAFYPAYELCQSLGLPVIVHCGTSTFPGARNQFGDPVLLDDVLRDFPRLDWVLAHGGRGWWYDAAAFLALSYSNVWIELSGLPPSRLKGYYVRHSWSRLTQRMIFATDWPGVPGIARNARAIAELLPDNDTRDLVLWANASRVYDLKVEPA